MEHPRKNEPRKPVSSLFTPLHFLVTVIFIAGVRVFIWVVQIWDRWTDYFYLAHFRNFRRPGDPAQHTACCGLRPDHYEYGDAWQAEDMTLNLIEALYSRPHQRRHCFCSRCGQEWIEQWRVWGMGNEKPTGLKKAG